MSETILQTPDLTQIASAKRMERSLAGIGAFGILTGSAAVAYFDPSSAGFFPVCPLYTMTGFACPGCGLTRGFHALFHGDVTGALDYNAMLPFFVVLIGFGFVSLVHYAVRGRGLKFNVLHPNFLWLFLVLLLVFGVTRNLPWYPFNILFP